MILDVALSYASRGWSVIPIQPRSKKAAVSWKQFQLTRPADDLIRQWFSPGGYSSMAVVLGKISGNLACRDFDDFSSYERWANSFPTLAQKLPTVETARGRHVYFQAEEKDIRKLSTTQSLTIHFDDGELRGGECYCLLPPSVHQTGKIYQWLQPPPEEIPLITDLFEDGLVPCNRENGRVQMTLRDTMYTPLPQLSLTTRSAQSSLLQDDWVASAIRETLPSGSGQRHRKLFEFARVLKGNPAFEQSPVNDLREFVRQWHTAALPFIETKAFEETWFDFAESWEKVKFPQGKGPLDIAFANARKAETPACAKHYQQEKLRLLVALCHKLQSHAGNSPFFLSVRTAAKLFDIDIATASRWLKGLCLDGVLACVSKGELKNRRASRFRYLAN